MAIVQMHKASDGTLHESFELFAKHEENLKIEQAFKEVELDMSVFFVNEDAGSSGLVLDDADIGKFIADNADVIRNILANSKVKRGRGKARKPVVILKPL